MADVVVWGVEYEFLRFLVQYCGLVLCILLVVCVVGGGCRKVFDRLDYTEDDRIIFLQYRGIHLCERRVESGERRAVVGERKIDYSVVIFLEKEPLKPWKSGRLGSKFSLKLTKKTPKPWNMPSKIVK